MRLVQIITERRRVDGRERPLRTGRYRVRSRRADRSSSFNLTRLRTASLVTHTARQDIAPSDFIAYKKTADSNRRPALARRAKGQDANTAI
ncbi:hypothetical protein EVAR_48993_1 [Eumeta japonica]|uniref:Uncharacterized protein n=1 Tax=Eumeta variegata TaxID=151549 RepID=A0A4C1Z122_EUMVA|nr:hypothetical protein EVAR_48993_1 [Eumeta japonica]